MEGAFGHGAVAPMGRAGDDPLPAHGLGDGVHRAGRRPGLRAIRGARGLPPRHPRRASAASSCSRCWPSCSCRPSCGAPSPPGCCACCSGGGRSCSASSCSWSCSGSSRPRPTTTGRPTTRSRPVRPDTTIVGGIEAHDTLTISANNIPHQTAYDVEPRCSTSSRSTPSRTGTSNGAPLDRVLIVGAGNGNDVAVALAQGAKHIDAVEIDPVIQALGSQLPPEPSVSGPAGNGPHRRRPGIHRAGRRPVRPDPVRPARLADAVRRPGQPPARELPLHRGVDANGPASTSGRAGTFAMYNYYEPFLLDRYASHAGGRVRHGAVRRGGRLAGRPGPGRAHRRSRGHARTATRRGPARGWPHRPTTIRSPTCSTERSRLLPSTPSC